MPSGAPHSGAARQRRKFEAKRKIAQAEFTSAEHNNLLRGPHPQGGWGGKKKMRSLGTVQMPTEAFMAVLKLDDEG